MQELALASAGALTPAIVDRQLERWLTSSLQSAVRLEFELVGAEDGPQRLVPVGGVATCPSAEVASAAAAEIRRQLAPAPDELVKELVVAVELVSARRRESFDASAIKLRLYVAELSKFPIDVVREMAARLIARRGPDAWFPALSEMLAVCDDLVARRRAMLRAFEEWRPQTEAEALLERAGAWRAQAAEAETALGKLFRGGNITDVTDPARAAELRAVIKDANAEARRLELAAREQRDPAAS